VRDLCDTIDDLRDDIGALEDTVENCRIVWRNWSTKQRLSRIEGELISRKAVAEPSPPSGMRVVEGRDYPDATK